MEALRWNDTAPMSALIVPSSTEYPSVCVTNDKIGWVVGVPHVIKDEDEYKGYRIPAGSIVITNCW